MSDGPDGPNRKTRRQQEAAARQIPVAPQVRLFPVHVTDIDDATRMRMANADPPVEYPIADVKTVQTYAEFTPTSVGVHPETGEPLVFFQCTFAVPIRDVCGHVPKTSRLLGPQGNAVSIEKALREAFAPLGPPMARIEMRAIHTTDAAEPTPPAFPQFDSANMPPTHIDFEQ